MFPNRLFVFSEPGQPLERPSRGASDLASRVASLEAATRYRWEDEMLGWGLIDLWNDDAAEGQTKFDLVRARYPHEADAVLHIAALRLPDAQDKDRAIQAGEQLLADHPANRWVLLAQGYLLQQRERTAEASRHFRTILELPNQEPDFVHRLFQAWSRMALAQMLVNDDPEQARLYLNQLVASGIEGEMLDEAKRMLATLD
jgi:tetratricopeptide (TPR) repeat protein